MRVYREQTLAGNLCVDKSNCPCGTIWCKLEAVMVFKFSMVSPIIQCSSYMYVKDYEN